MKITIAVLLGLFATQSHALIVDALVKGADEWTLTHFGPKSQVYRMHISQSPARDGAKVATITVSQAPSFGGLVHITSAMTASGGAVGAPNGIGPDLPGSVPAVGSVTFPWASVCGRPSCANMETPLILWIDNNPSLTGGHAQYMVTPNADDQLTIMAQTN